MLLKITFNEFRREKEKNFQGQYNFGSWEIEHLESSLQEGINSINNTKNYSIGLSCDRNSPQYQVVISKEKIQIYSESFGLSPLYLFSNEKFTIIASDINLIRDKLQNEYSLKFNNRFILDKALFNYSLFQDTVFKEIILVPSNHIVEITNSIQFRCVLNIEEEFTSKPIPYKKSIGNLVDLFISLNKNKIKNDDFISFTSGFDGRSLIALSRYLNKKVSAYSFGSHDNVDISLPIEQSQLINQDFIPIYLDENDYLYKFATLSDEVIMSSAANSNILQLHWYYASEFISKKASTIIMGLFGSELFRAAHIAGQFTSPALVGYFKDIEGDTWINKLHNSDSLKFLNADNFKNELESLIADLKQYKEKVIHLTESQRFYKYIFDEVFRKFFGMQIIQPMRNNVNVINPYIDSTFVIELLKTELAGVNNDFFTHNPLKRFKGQLFYAELLKRISPEMLPLITGKGYSPGDLLTSLGRLKIAIAYANKKVNPKLTTPNLDNLAIISGFERHKSKFLSIGINEDYFNKKYILDILNNNRWKTDAILRDKLFETLSINYYINSLK
ncbi:MAG: hypothetical protein JXB49_36660 [Bacteroidales bacterium]|nr:hypothetical protein [Bacteroidales bacterium]